jgi:hypothetical protein
MPRRTQGTALEISAGLAVLKRALFALASIIIPELGLLQLLPWMYVQTGSKWYTVQVTKDVP